MGTGPDPISEEMFLAACKEACIAQESCEGIVRVTHNDDDLFPIPGNCSLRKNLQIENCEKNTIYTLHVKVEGTI